MEAGLDVLRKQGRIDLLLTDIVMPGGNGRELATQAATLRPDVQVLFMTGYSRNAVVHQGRLDEGVEPIAQACFGGRPSWQLASAWHSTASDSLRCLGGRVCLQNLLNVQQASIWWLSGRSLGSFRSLRA